MQWLIIVSPVRMYLGAGGGYYGLVIITQRPLPRPPTFICECDNLKNPEWIASIYLYVAWYRGEDSWEARCA